MIKLDISPVAERRLLDNLGEQSGVIKMFYDNEGCGCDGVTTLLIQNQGGKYDVAMDAGSFSFVIDQQHQLFYESVLRLDAEENYSDFKLVSHSMIYSTHVNIRDVRQKITD